jgi:hypothetical protein
VHWQPWHHTLKTIRSWPAVHTFLPNAILLKDHVVLETENENVTAERFVDFLIEKAGFSEDEKKILLASSNFSKSLPADPGVEAYLIYNSAVKMKLGVNVKTGKRIKIKGDGVANAEGTHWVCKNWKKVKCVELKEQSLVHRELKQSPLSLNIAVESLTREVPSQDGNGARGRSKIRKNYTKFSG